MIRLVCFDLGGVVLRICRSWTEGCAAAGVPHREDVDVDALLAQADWGATSDAYQRGDLDFDDYARAFVAATGGAYDAEALRRVHDAWILGAYRGVDAVIDALHGAGVATAVLSNTNAEHWRLVDRWPVVFSVGTILASHEIRAVKPDAEAYAHVERACAARPGEILFFDDLEPNVRGAVARGWRAVRIDHAGDTAAQIRAALAESGVPGFGHSSG